MAQVDPSAVGFVTRIMLLELVLRRILLRAETRLPIAFTAEEYEQRLKDIAELCYNALAGSEEVL